MKLTKPAAGLAISMLLAIALIGCQQEVATAGKNESAPPRHVDRQVDPSSEQATAAPGAGDRNTTHSAEANKEEGVTESASDEPESAETEAAETEAAEENAGATREGSSATNDAADPAEREAETLED